MDDFAMKDWYLWPCTAYRGDFNMAADDGLSRMMMKSLDRPVLRFFTWNPYCISLGYHQKKSGINLRLCKDRHVDLVRRPTGGRAILHAEELTYSVIYPYRDLDLSDFYRLIHLPMVEVLKKIGIPAKFEPVQPDFRTLYKTDKSALCFASSARFEVKIDGKKLIGSAQRVYENAILQHGSILLGGEHQNLIDFLLIDEKKHLELKKYIQDHTSFLWDYHTEVTAGSLAKQITDEFTNMFGIHFRSFDQPAKSLPRFSALYPQNSFSIFAA